MAGHTITNKSWFLKDYPKGLPEESLFDLRESQVSTDLPEGSEDVLVKVLYLSLDPYMRGRMKAGGSGYAQGFPLDKVRPARLSWGFGGGINSTLRVSGV
jgi:NADPH-dependent curcumin reductase CurA